MKVIVKRKNSHGTTHRYPTEDNRWRNVSEKSAGKNTNGRAAIRAAVIPRVTRRGA